MCSFAPNLLRRCCVAKVLPRFASIFGHLPSVSDAYKMLSGASKNNTKLKNYTLRICSDFVASPVFFQHLRWSDVGSSKRSGAQNSYKKQTFFINGLWRRLGGDAGWSEDGPELRRGQKSCMDWFSVASRVRRRRKARLPAPKQVTSVFDFLLCVATGGSGYLHRGIRLGGGCNVFRSQK